MLVIAGRYAAPLFLSLYGFLFWAGTVLLGILVPLWLHRKGRISGAGSDPLMLSAVLVLFGGALLRIALVQAGQI